MRRKPSCARDVPAGVYNFSNFKMSQRKVEPVRASQTRFPHAQRLAKKLVLI
jgi:hypothetical protein